MSDIEQKNEALQDDPAKPGVDHTRRRLATAALGSGVILTLKSHPVLATTSTNECTKSALLSGNLSHHQSNVQCGCSPGYWGQHPEVWDKLTEYRFSPSAKFNTVFGCQVFNNNTTLLDVATMNSQSTTILSSAACCSGGGSGMGFSSKVQASSFHAVAGICNAATFAWRYLPSYDTPDKIITAYKNAFTAAKTYKDCGAAFEQLKTNLDKYNNLYCGYNAAGIYQ